MKRREFTLNLGLGAIGASSLLALPARAQGEPVEGKDYTRLQTPVAVAVPGKIEVVEFFGYWCPHCNAFEPALEAWVAKLPASVNFRRIPVVFNATHEPYQKLYFALEALGLVAKLHGKVFNALHVQRQRLEKDAEVSAFAAANGVDGAKLIDTMKSFSVVTKGNQARQMAQNFHIDGVPTLGIQGRYLTSVSQAGSGERALQVTDALIRKARSAG